MRPRGPGRAGRGLAPARVAVVELAALAALLGLHAVACGKRDPGAAPGADAGASRRYAARDGGALRACATAADCEGRGPAQVCFFGQPDVESPTGVCGRADPPCVVSRPYCTADRRTIWACTFPTEPWLRAGACEDGAAR